jgi:hypothetical protein
MPSFLAAIRSSSTGSALQLARRALDLGYQGIALGHPLHARDWEELGPALPRDSIASVELFLPYPRQLRAGEPCPFHLDSSGAEDKQEAVRQGVRTIQFAEAHQIPTVLVPVMKLEGGLRRDCLLRAPARNFQSGTAPQSAEKLRSENPKTLPRQDFEERMALLWARRKAGVSRPMDSYRSVVYRLLEAAARYGRRLALACGGWIDEVPGIEEAFPCLEEFAGSPCLVWLDSVLECVAGGTLYPRESAGLLEHLKEQIAGTTLRDSAEDGSPAVLGTGCLQWEKTRPLLKACEAWMADPPLDSPGESLGPSLEFLARLASGPELEIFPGLA